MKTFEDCKQRVAKRFLAKRTGDLLIYYPLVENAAELYGRYSRFVGQYGMKGRYILFEIIDLYPSGGMGDSRGNFDTIEECIAAFKKLESCYICYVYDRLTNKEIDIETLSKR